MLLGRDLSHSRSHHARAPCWAAARERRGQDCPWPVPLSLSSAQPVGSGFARTRSCFGNSLTQESRFILPPLCFAVLSPLLLFLCLLMHSRWEEMPF